MADAGPEQGQATPGRKPWLGAMGVAAAVAVVIAFAAALYYVYDHGVRRGMEFTPPLIKAEPGPNKVPPEAPGGLEVPHQDKLVYDAIESNEVESAAEKLLPPPEQPLAKPVAEDPAPQTQPAPPAAAPAAALATDTAAASVIEDAGTDDAVVSADEAPADSATTDEASAVAIVAPTETASAPPPAPAAPATSTPAPPAYRVQIAAYRTPAAADAGWERLKAAHKDLLGELEPTVTEVDLGTGKGVFHRLQVGPLADADAARALCARLSERKQGCLVVRP